MPYDNYGWILNLNEKEMVLEDRGDSCFFMGLQALNFLLQGEVNRAKELYRRVKKYDFVRHPSVLDEEIAGGYWKNQTSYDMLVIWDLISNRFPNIGIEEPPYHYRRSRYFFGSFRFKKMYSVIIAIFVYGLMSLVFKINYIFKKVCQKRFHHIHTIMLYFGVVLAKLKNKNNIKGFTFLKGLLKKFITKIEKELGYEHIFFRWLIFDEDLSGGPIIYHNIHEWVWQRNLKVNPFNRHFRWKRFHYELCKVEGEIVEVDLSEQFYFSIKGKKLIYLT